MARMVRDEKLGSGPERRKLAPQKRHWRGIHPGLAVGYRRARRGGGTWYVRAIQKSGGYWLKALGVADDYARANGADVLTFEQAQRRAGEVAEEHKRQTGTVGKPLTVAQAAANYLAWFREHRKAVAGTEAAINAHIKPALGERIVAELTAPDIRAWLEDLAATPARLRTSATAEKQKHRAPPKTEEQKRARRASANRIFSVLRALLNRAYRDSLVPSAEEWKRVQPFGRADAPRIRFLNDAEAARLVNACKPDLRALVHGALLTGARYGELAALSVQDVSLEDRNIYVAPGKGKARHIKLNDDALELFRELTAGKLGDAFVFTKSDGEPWGKNHATRPLKLACKRAKIVPDVRFHELRHTFASALARAGVDLLTISKLLGHADTRVTTRHYAHLADESLALAVAKLPNFSVLKNEAKRGKVRAIR